MMYFGDHILRKASVIAEIYNSNFCVFVFVCDFHLEISSFLGKSFQFLFLFIKQIFSLVLRLRYLKEKYTRK
jgi:hypothetical protein